MRPRVVADAAQPRLRVARRAASTRAGCRRRRTSRARRSAAGSGAARVVYGLGPSSKVSATASPRPPPHETICRRASICWNARCCAQAGGKLGRPEPGRRSLRRRHRRRDEGDEEQGGEQRSHHIRSLSASTFATNGFDTLYTPCSLTARSPWYQPASASDSLPWNTCKQVAEVQDPHLDVAVDRVRDLAAGEHRLDVHARRRQRLQHAARAGRRDDARLVARLHPGERAHEVRVDAEPGSTTCRAAHERRSASVRARRSPRGRAAAGRSGSACSDRCGSATRRRRSSCPRSSRSP